MASRAPGRPSGVCVRGLAGSQGGSELRRRGDSGQWQGHEGATSTCFQWGTKKTKKGLIKLTPRAKETGGACVRCWPEPSTLPDTHSTVGSEEGGAKLYEVKPAGRAGGREMDYKMDYRWKSELGDEQIISIRSVRHVEKYIESVT